MNERFSITYPEELRCLCIRENWFTCGSNRQYEKLFQMNEGRSSVNDIALVIWICSDEVEFDEIYDKLQEAKAEYMRLEGEDYDA